MITGKRTTLCVLWISLITACANGQVAKRICFTGRGGSGDWHNPANWDRGIVPGVEHEAGIIVGTVVITNTVIVGNLKAGMSGEGPAIVNIDGGTLTAVGNIQYNSATYRGNGTLIIQNGGSASFNQRFYVGMEETPRGSVIIHDGTLCVANVYHHNKAYKGTETLDTRTTINKGGLLDVDDLILNSGVMDVAGGTLIIRRNIAYEVTQWIATGRMIAMGGAEGWKIEVTTDDATGASVIIAVPTDPAQPKPKPLPVPERKPFPAAIPTPPPPAPKPVNPPPLEPFTVGMLKPSVCFSAPPAG